MIGPLGAGVYSGLGFIVGAGWSGAIFGGIHYRFCRRYFKLKGLEAESKMLEQHRLSVDSGQFDEMPLNSGSAVAESMLFEEHPGAWYLNNLKEKLPKRLDASQLSDMMDGVRVNTDQDNDNEGQ